jgi:hypothetical protein
MRKVAALVTNLGVQPNVFNGSAATLCLAIETGKWVGVRAIVQVRSANFEHARSTAFGFLLWFLLQTTRKVAAFVTALGIPPN